MSLPTTIASIDEFQQREPDILVAINAPRMEPSCSSRTRSAFSASTASRFRQPYRHSLPGKALRGTTFGDVGGCQPTTLLCSPINDRHHAVNLSSRS